MDWWLFQAGHLGEKGNYVDMMQPTKDKYWQKYMSESSPYKTKCSPPANAKSPDSKPAAIGHKYKKKPRRMTKEEYERLTVKSFSSKKHFDSAVDNHKGIQPLRSSMNMQQRPHTAANLTRAANMGAYNTMASDDEVDDFSKLTEFPDIRVSRSSSAPLGKPRTKNLFHVQDSGAASNDRLAAYPTYSVTENAANGAYTVSAPSGRELERENAPGMDGGNSIIKYGDTFVIENEEEAIQYIQKAMLTAVVSSVSPSSSTRTTREQKELEEEEEQGSLCADGSPHCAADNYKWMHSNAMNPELLMKHYNTGFEQFVPAEPSPPHSPLAVNSTEHSSKARPSVKDALRGKVEAAKQSSNARKPVPTRVGTAKATIRAGAISPEASPNAIADLTLSADLEDMNRLLSPLELKRLKQKLKPQVTADGNTIGTRKLPSRTSRTNSPKNRSREATERLQQAVLAEERAAALAREATERQEQATLAEQKMREEVERATEAARKADEREQQAVQAEIAVRARAAEESRMAAEREQHAMEQLQLAKLALQQAERDRELQAFLREDAAAAAQRLEMRCCVCLDAFRRCDGYTCTGMAEAVGCDQFTCWACMQCSFIAAGRPDAIQGRLNDDGELLCSHPRCKCPITVARLHAANAPAATLGAQLELCVQVVRDREVVRALAEERVRNNAERERILALATADQRAAATLKEIILDTVLILECPSCHGRIDQPDFQECLVLTCQCDAMFCAWCFAVCDDISGHSHVANCPQNPRPGYIYASREVYNEFHGPKIAGRCRERILAADLTAGAVRILQEELSLHLIDLNISVVDAFPISLENC